MNEQELIRRLENLRIEHRDLDAAIAALTASGTGDQLQLMRLKKRKLAIRDQIFMIEDNLLPDIIA
ncbi:YdcH family protein [Qipengyuania sp.]|uniref:YdcH family protein n=1 Tax=Qipengyuania sp. TaxID=2004515 RepID=UPI0035C7FC95